MTPHLIKLACRLHERAVSHRAAGKLDQAESLGQRALALLEKAAGPDHPDVANVLNHLAGIHVDRSDYAKAERLYRRAVRILEQCARLQSQRDCVLQPRVARNELPWVESPATTNPNGVVSARGTPSRNPFGVDVPAPESSPARGWPKRVRPATVRSPEFSRQGVRTSNRVGKLHRPGQSNALAPEGGTPNNQDADIDRLRVQSLGDLASLYRVQGRYEEAEPLFHQALDLAERAFGPDDLEVSSVLNNLAVLYKYTGRFAEAGRLYQRALSITEKALGSEHPEVATIYHNLGGLEHASGNFARGEPFARRSVAIREKALGPDHPEVAADVAALAALLDGQKKYAEAERLYRRALAVFERVHGSEHYEIAVNLNNVAALYHATGRASKAEAFYARALAIKEKLLGSDHPDVAMTLNNLAVFYKSQKRYAQAEPLYRRALAIFEKALGPKHPNVAACLENFAQSLRRMKRAAEARTLDARAKAIRDGIDSLGDGELVVTASINPLFACFSLAVRPSKIHRWGVFAEEKIPARRKVIEYTGERISRREARRRSARSMEFLFRLNSYWWLDGAIGGSGAEYINHSCDPNVYSCLVKGHILYFSKCSIEPGEELTVDYRFSPSSRIVRCHCASPRCRGTINTK